MKRVFISLFWLSILFLESCIPFRYAEPQPTRGRELSHFPKSMCGLYVTKGEDSIRIEKDRFYVGEEEALLLQDSNVYLKKMRGGLVLSLKSYNQDGDQMALGGWEVIPIRAEGDSLWLYFLPASSSKVIDETFEAIQNYVEAEEIETDDDEYYMIKAQKNAFKTLWKKGLYAEVVGYYKQ